MSGYRLALLGDFNPSFHVRKVKVMNMHCGGFTTEYAGEKSTCLPQKVVVRSLPGRGPSSARALAQTADRLRVHRGKHTSISKQHKQ